MEGVCACELMKERKGGALGEPGKGRGRARGAIVDITRS